MTRERILVATDMSARSELAVKKAIALAKKYDLWLEVLHVIDPPVFEWTWGSEHLEEKEKHDELRKERSKSVSSKIAEELHRRHDKVNVFTRVGTPHNEIIQYAKEKNVSGIVIGDTGEHHPLKNFFFGSTAKNVMEATHIPVLVARNEQGADYKKILVPIDFSEESMDTVKQTSRLFPDAEIYLLHITEIPSETRMRYYGLDETEIRNIADGQRKVAHEKMLAFMNDLKLSQPLYPVYAEGSLNAEIVLNEGERLQADLISLSPHKIAGVTSRMVRSIAEDIMKESTQDILIYQNV